MPAKYKLVLRKDMRKDAAEGSKLYYASANTTGTCDVYELCDLISAQSTASSGDVKLIRSRTTRSRRSLPVLRTRAAQGAKMSARENFES